MHFIEQFSIKVITINKKDCWRLGVVMDTIFLDLNSYYQILGFKELITAKI